MIAHLLTNLPSLIVVLPLLAATLMVIIGRRRRILCQPIAALTMLVTTAAAAILLVRVIDAEGSRISYWLGGWTPETEGKFAGVPFGIEYTIDRLNALVALIVAVIGTLAMLFARSPIASFFGEKEPHFYALGLLFLTGMFGMTMTGDVFNLYVLIEISSITGYALIAMGKGSAPVAAFHYVLIGTIGASFYLLGVGYLYMLTGSLNMADLHRLLAGRLDEPLARTALAFVLVGFGVKMSVFPLHWWMPNAYSCAPNAVSALLAPLFTKVSFYAMARLVFSVFGIAALSDTGAGALMVAVASAGVVYGMVMAVRQVELKRMITYVLVAEMSYFLGGLGLANATGCTGALLHIGNDAVMMLALFAISGSIAYRRRDYRIASMRGLFRDMPLTAPALVVAMLAVVGVPPTGGFFTKWYLVMGALEAGRYDFAAALLVGSALAAFLAFRLFEIMRRDGSGIPGEVPLGMRVVTITAAAGTLATGLATGLIVDLIAPIAAMATR